MSNDHNPWDGLSVPSAPGNFSTRRVSANTPHDFYWAKNDLGQCCLVFSCETKEPVKMEQVRLRGIELQQFSRDQKKLDIIIKLIDDPSRDLFRTISNDLVASTQKLPPTQPKTVVHALSTRLKRWQQLLGRRKTDLLSTSEQLGLFGELLFLRDHFLGRLDNSTAVSAWQGPSGSEQDFGWSSYLFEVKTQLSSSDRRITINSLEQLDDISGDIWLIHQTVAAEESSGSDRISLKRLVNDIRGSLTHDVFSSDYFNTSLLEYGYEDNDAYDEVFYQLVQRNVFSVKDDFPRLTRSSIPKAITSARYILDATALQEMEVTLEQFAEQVFNNGKD